MVYYRKYRPQTIEELDSEEVKKSLHLVLSQKEIPHAFLFTGPKGLGKTSTARIVAKYVNCERHDAKGKKEKGSIPCNECISCTSITEGTNIDILEIDGASNRGIDEIRDLREKIRLLPAAAKKKVYIIDEVHMLTTEAFNALLKTLEEPPPHAMFILCTTEQQKVPATIVSRCFHIQFKKANTLDLVHSFERIVKGEKIDADKKALSLIASFADGSFRDGSKILEEIAQSLSGKKLTSEMVDTLYHVTSIDHDITHFLKALEAKDAKKGLETIQHVLEIGVDIRYFTENILLALHELLLEKTGIVPGQKRVDVNLETVKTFATAISGAYTEMKYAVLPQLPLELAVVDLTKESVVVGHTEEVVVSEKKKTPDVQKKPVSTSSREDKTFLYQLLDGIKIENHMLAGVLRSCKIQSVTDEAVIIEAASSFHKQRLEDKKALEVLEKVCKDITGKNLRVSVVLKLRSGGE